MSMRKSYIAKLALKNIIGHRLRSFLTITGIAIGVGFIIFLISLGYGLQRISTQEIANLDALQIIDVTPGKSQIVKVNDESVEKFSGIGDVSKVEPQIELVGTFKYGTSSVEGVVYGKNIEYLELEELDYFKGKQYSSNDANEVIVNITTARQTGIDNMEDILGKDLTISMNISSEMLAESEEKPVSAEADYTIVGIINNEDSPYVYVPLNKIKEWDVVNYSSAKVKVNDKEKTDVARQQIESLGFKTVALKDTVDQINQFFSIFQLILLAFGSIAVLIAALGMFNTLTISLLEKTREISFMKILGTTSGNIWELFIAEAIIIGIIGGTIGIIFGLGVGNILNGFIANLAAQTGNTPVQIFYAPISFVVITFLAALLVSFLTGIYPSHRASQIDPLEAMRYE